MNARDMNRLLFLRWLRGSHPELFAAAANATVQQLMQPRTGLSGILDSISSAFGTFVDKLPELSQAYVNLKSQYDWVKVNIERVKAGLRPIDPSTGKEVEPSNTAPPPEADSNLARLEALLMSTQQQLATAQANAANTMPVWMWAVIGIAALIVVPKLIR